VDHGVEERAGDVGLQQPVAVLAEVVGDQSSER
jgi:hypothetical protein